MAGSALLGLGLSLLTTLPADAGTFTADFAAGIPPGMSIYGSATGYDHTTGGRAGGALKLTTATASQSSSAIVEAFDSWDFIVGGFDVTFNAYVGSGNGADGFSFVFGDFYDGTFAEEGPGTIRGLTIAFDVYNNGGTPAEAPAIDVKWNNTTLFHRLVGAASATSPAAPIGSATTIRTQTTSGGAAVWWPVKIHVDPDGTLDLVYNNVVIFTNLPVFRPFLLETEGYPQYSSAYRFGFGARTGGSYDNHWIDDLNIVTYPVENNVSGQPGLTSVSQQPAGYNAGAAGGAMVVLTNSLYSVDPASVTMRYNNATVTPTVTQVDGLTTISYYGTDGVLPAGAGKVDVSYSTTSTPPFANTFSYNFVVDPFVTIDTNAVVTSVDTSKPGFKVRIVQNDVRRTPGNNTAQTIQAERQLALGYIDPSTGQPYPNTAELSMAELDGTFIETGVINYNVTAPANAGGFNGGSNPPREDKLFPGIPGLTTVLPANENFAMEATAFIQLKAGGHRFGVNSDDGFRVTLGTGFDAAGTQLGVFAGSRGTADTFFDVLVPADGYYSVRLVHCQGGGGGSCEFFYFNPATGQKVLVNDPDNLAAPRAYRESSVSNPSLTRALPVQNWIGASPDEDVIVDITDGAYAVTTPIALYINGALQTTTVTKNGKVTTIKRAGSLDNLLPSGLNNVQVAYSFNKGATPVTVTNSYSFSVAPYYGVLSPNYRVTGVSEPGFRAKVHQMDKSGDANQGNGARINGGSDSNRMPFPEIQLAEGMINPTNGLPYPNLAQAGANNFLHDFDVINWQYNSANADTAQAGWVRTDSPFAPFLGARSDIGVPGLPGTGTSYGGLENAVLEITTHLELKRGAHVFGFNSDDGFVAMFGPDAHDTLGTLVGFDNRGKGASDTMVAPTGGNPPQITPYVASGSMFFSVIVPEDGIYPFRILFWQGGTGFNAEFFSINKTNGAFVLVGDTASGGIPAYRTYNGTPRPYVKFSVCPSPWDNAVQQAGPGPIKMVGRTRNAVNSSDIYNYPNVGLGIIPRPWANAAIGGVIANGTSDPNIKLLLNGVEVPATKTPSGTDVTVAYTPEPPLPPGSTNTASLVYAGTTNSWTWITETWTTLDAGVALPASQADADARGFKVTMHKLAAAPANANTLDTAERQLAGELGANQAMPGPEADGSFIFTNIINWNNNVNPNRTGVQLGNFQAATGYAAGTGWPFAFRADEPVPGVPNTTSNPANNNTDYLAAEVFAYLEFPTAGFYRFGVNSDDAFGLKIGTPGVQNGMVIRAYNTGKGASDLTASFVVPQAGLYPIRLVYYNGTGGGNLEYFSYDANGTKIAINDRDNPAAIRAYYAVSTVAAPVITGSTITGGTITVTWDNGGTLESAPAITGPWTSTGDSDGSFSEPATGEAKFYRVKL